MVLPTYATTQEEKAELGDRVRDLVRERRDRVKDNGVAVRNPMLWKDEDDLKWAVAVRNPMLWKDEDDLKWAVKHQATKMGLKVNDVQLSDLKDKWGHTTVNTSRPNNSRETPAIPNVTLNKDLLTLPKKLGEFVIVHELAHTLAPNHSKLFKTFMSAYMPDWEDRESELQKYSSKKTQSAKPSKK